MSILLDRGEMLSPSAFSQPVQVSRLIDVSQELGEGVGNLEIRTYDPYGVYSKMHAKCMIGDCAALWLGSLNLTETGFFGNTETVAVVTSAAPVAEALAWFEKCWSVSKQLGEETLETAWRSRSTRSVSRRPRRSASVEIDADAGFARRTHSPF